MLVALAAIALILVTFALVVADNYMQQKPNLNRATVNSSFRRKNVWELTQLDCDLGCAWPHTSGPARTLRVDSKRRRTRIS